jgi:MFS family permease
MMAVKDPKTWLHGVVQVMCLTVLYGFSVFLPIILRFGFNYSVKESQYLSIPVFAWGSIVYGVAGYLSDRFSRRFLACILCAPLGMIGYALLLGGQDFAVGVKYFACFLIASCAWMLGGGNLAWLSTVSEGSYHSCCEYPNAMQQIQNIRMVADHTSRILLLTANVLHLSASRCR